MGTTPQGPPATAAIDVDVNGAPLRVAVGTTLLELAAAHGVTPDTRGVAIARNGTVAPRGTWIRVVIAEGDRIEIVRAAAGG